jgi:nicotinamidase-related amidase
MARALVIVDIQNDYFPGGRCELVGPEQAAERASAVLAGFRERGEPVFHVQHLWEGDDAEYLSPGTPGVEIHESVRPAAGERSPEGLPEQLPRDRPRAEAAMPASPTW